MKVQDILDMVAEKPEIAEYELCLSDFFAYEDDGEVHLISDFPILGIATNDEDREMRFVLTTADVSLLERGRDHIHALVRRKGVPPGEIDIPTEEPK